MLRRLCSLFVACLSLPLIAAAQLPNPLKAEPGGKLIFTGGISTLEGGGGGALTPWALITGNETNRGIGASAHYTDVILDDFRLQSFGGAIGFYDRFEVSYTRQVFDTQDAGAALGLGEGFTFEQDIYGAKLRLIGDAIYGQDTWLPQMAVGVQYKNSNRDALVSALGAEDGDGVDVYLSATKLILSQSLLVNATLRYTDANQGGLLGFGGASAPVLQPEFSLGYQLSRKLFVGGEYRFRPDRLAFAQEDDAYDLFVAYAPTRNITLTAAYADLGSVATFDDQNGVYLTLQLGF